MANPLRVRIDLLLRGIFRKPDPSPQELQEEVQFHLEARIQQLIARGLAPAAARVEALRRFGELEAESGGRGRMPRVWLRLEGVRQDLRYAARGLRSAPGFTVAAVLILGLGIGANAAMFQVVDRLLLRPPPLLRHPDLTHRVYLLRDLQASNHAQGNIQYRRYLDLMGATRSLRYGAAVYYTRAAVGVGDDSREMRIGAVSASTFDLFDAKPVIGRYFTSAEDTVPAGADVAVLSDLYWSTGYGRDPSVLGRSIQIGPRTFTIIGVAPAGFRATSSITPVAFIPITTFGYSLLGSGNAKRYYADYSWSWMEMIAERKPGVRPRAAIDDLTDAFHQSYQAQLEVQPGLAPLAVARPRALLASVAADGGPNESNDAKVATWLVGVAAIVLLIACANVANLLLARGFRRRREIALRLALGVGRGRLLAQLFTESLVLASLGAIAGLILAHWGGGVLRAEFLSESDPEGVLQDGRTVLFTAMAMALVALLTGIAPALHALRSDVAGSLKAGARDGGYHRSPVRIGLLIVQAALSVVLLVGAGLFVRSLHQLNAMRLGYDADQLVYLSPAMRGVELDSAGRQALRERLLVATQAIPGVESATRASTVPFYLEWDQSIFVPGLDTAAINRMGSFTIQTGTSDYFRTMGTRLLRGRGFTDADRAGGARVMVVSQPMARALWPGQDPLGKCVRVGADTAPCVEVVGVAERTYTKDLRDDPGLGYYLPIAQAEPDGGGIFARVRGDAARQAESFRHQLQPIMPGIAYLNAIPLSERLIPERRSWRLGATMFTIFGGLALLLAAFGLYTVVAYSVAQRGHELGVRMALGAQPGNLLRLVLQEGLRVAAAGVTIGIMLALWAARWIEPLLYQVSSRDPAVFGLVAAVLLVSATLATLVPAVRATRVDPVSALKAD